MAYYEKILKLIGDNMTNFNQHLLDEIDDFKALGQDFLDKKVSKMDFKKVSGGFGVYAQKDGEHFILRLRIPCGIAKQKDLRLIHDLAQKYQLKNIHLTTRQCIQLHNLTLDQVCEIMRLGISQNLYTRGTGGNYPRNVAVSPLSGLCPHEVFDILPFALAVNTYFLTRITDYHLPRKLKVSFSNTPHDASHATVQDMGFVATSKDDKPYFILFFGGGLGLNPRCGIELGELIETHDVLYHIEAMVQLFIAEGDYQNRSKARIRYIVEKLGEDGFIHAYNHHLEKVKAQHNLNLQIPITLNPIFQQRYPNTLDHGDSAAIHTFPYQAPTLIDLDTISAHDSIHTTSTDNSDAHYLTDATNTDKHNLVCTTTTDHQHLVDPIHNEPSSAVHPRLIAQQQKGLYSIYCHPIGGELELEHLSQLCNLLETHDLPEIRLSMSEGFYFINLTDAVAQEIGTFTQTISGSTRLSQSTACIGAPICQLGTVESQSTLHAIINYFNKKQYTKDTLPKLYISGCPNSCGVHQIGSIGLTGKIKKIDDTMTHVFALYLDGSFALGQTRLGTYYGDIDKSKVPEFLYTLATTIDSLETNFEDFIITHQTALQEILDTYLL